MQKFVSAAQLAERFEVNGSTIWRWVAKGVLPKPIKISEGCSRFDVDAVDAHIAARDVQPRDVSVAVAASVGSEKRRRKNGTEASESSDAPSEAA